MTTSTEKIHQLPFSGEANVKIALQLLKSQRELPAAMAQKLAPALPKLKEVAIYQNSFDAAERERVRALLLNCTVYV